MKSSSSSSPRLWSALMAVSVLLGSPQVFAGKPTINFVSVDAQNKELVITGVGLKVNTTVPYVTLGGNALTVKESGATEVVAELPDLLPTGQYLLLLDNATFRAPYKQTPFRMSAATMDVYLADACVQNPRSPICQQNGVDCNDPTQARTNPQCVCPQNPRDPICSGYDSGGLVGVPAEDGSEFSSL